ncbi:MAG: HAD hydrolase-like protein [Verrucomicrobia bacterium]|nr:HAD hydrolase-like protein [Verrucomicrobiota bacterium]MBU1908962.1 HAD hydrolase-like protein [Verrucomicrobiota bacterium]
MRTGPPTLGAPDDRLGVLFDIDGTLLDTRGAGQRSFVRALETVFGWRDDIAYVSFAGNTDLNVLQQVMAAHGRELNETDRRTFFARLPEELERAAEGVELILFPGVRELLEALSAAPRALLGLVTGNIEACARIKLRHCELHGHFVLGAFGDEHADRERIAHLALQRLHEALAPGARLSACYLVGDTPFDITAASSIGAVSVAVATGKFDAAALRQAGADHVLTDLSDTAAVLRLLGLR